MLLVPVLALRAPLRHPPPNQPPPPPRRRRPRRRSVRQASTAALADVTADARVAGCQDWLFPKPAMFGIRSAGPLVAVASHAADNTATGTADTGQTAAAGAAATTSRLRIRTVRGERQTRRRHPRRETVCPNSRCQAVRGRKATPPLPPPLKPPVHLRHDSAAVVAVFRWRLIGACAPTAICRGSPGVTESVACVRPPRRPACPIEPSRPGRQTGLLVLNAPSWEPAS